MIFGPCPRELSCHGSVFFSEPDFRDFPLKSHYESRGVRSELMGCESAAAKPSLNGVPAGLLGYRQVLGAQGRRLPIV